MYSVENDVGQGYTVLVCLKITSVCSVHVWIKPLQNPNFQRTALNVGEQVALLVRQVRRSRAAQQHARFPQQSLSGCREQLQKANEEIDCLKGAQLLLLDGNNIFLY